jgi:hypothetical protein
MPPWHRSEGQASVELIALLPLAALLVAGAWQLAIAGHAAWSADAAARAAARSAAVGADARAAATRSLPGVLDHGALVRDSGDGRVEVTVRIPRVLGLPRMGHVSATAHFRPQR